MSASELLSRRKALFGLAALLTLAAAPTLLTVSDAEAETAPATTPPSDGLSGTKRRQDRRTARTKRRQERRTARTKRRQDRRTGRTKRREERAK